LLGDSSSSTGLRYISDFPPFEFAVPYYPF
jgi:hypothetical protein